MKKVLPLLILLLLLSAAYFIFLRKPAEDNVFHIEDPTAVGRVELEKVVKGKSEKSLSIQRGSTDEWLVNEKHIAIPAKVDVFLSTLSQIRVQKPVEEKGLESALALIKRNYTSVRILDREGGELKHYLIGATNNQQTANLMMMYGSDQAYYVNKPGQVGYVSVLYTVNDYDWREKLLWNLKAEQLQAVGADYGATAEGFQLQRPAPDAAWQLQDGSPAAAEAMNSYLGLFEGKVYAESFAGIDYPGLMDSLQKRMPDVRFSFKTLDGKSDALLLFVRPENANNFFGYMESQKELYTVQHHVIDKFLKTAAFFVQKPS